MSIGTSLDNTERVAVAAFVRFDRQYQEFVAELQPSHVKDWDDLIKGYEQDPTSTPDPYYWKATGEFHSAAEIEPMYSHVPQV